MQLRGQRAHLTVGGRRATPSPTQPKRAGLAHAAVPTRRSARPWTLSGRPLSRVDAPRASLISPLIALCCADGRGAPIVRIAGQRPPAWLRADPHKKCRTRPTRPAVPGAAHDAACTSLVELSNHVVTFDLTHESMNCLPSELKEVYAADSMDFPQSKPESRPDSLPSACFEGIGEYPRARCWSGAPN